MTITKRVDRQVRFACANAPVHGAVEASLRTRIKTGRKCLVPFFTAGFPDARRFASLLRAAEDQGCDAVEVGIPFSDPIADGPAIQFASRCSLDAGNNVHTILELLDRSRLQIPMILMGYLNPILTYGVRRFADDARATGVAGLIIPDLPCDFAAKSPGSSPLAEIGLGWLTQGFELTLLAAPTSSAERLAQIGRTTCGFLYAVTVIGTTGVRQRLPRETNDFLRSARDATTRPVLAGFGIADASAARSVAAFCDGVVVGSALIERMKTGSPGGAVKRVAELLSKMRRAL